MKASNSRKCPLRRLSCSHRCRWRNFLPLKQDYGRTPMKRTRCSDGYQRNELPIASMDHPELRRRKNIRHAISGIDKDILLTGHSEISSKCWISSTEITLVQLILLNSRAKAFVVKTIDACPVRKTSLFRKAGISSPMGRYIWMQNLFSSRGETRNWYSHSPTWKYWHCSNIRRALIQWKEKHTLVDIQ